MSVYTTGGNTSNVSLGVSAAPVGQHASFDFGCGGQDGTAACKLGQVDAGSAARQVQAQIPVPATSTVTSVRLTATASADHLPARPQAAVTVAVASGVGAAAKPTNYLTNPAFRNVSFLPVINPGGGAGPITVPGTGTSLIPGGNASGLFPSVGPDAQSGSLRSGAADPHAGNVLAFALAGMSETKGQIAGLAALALAILLAVVRVEVLARPRFAARRRSASGK